METATAENEFHYDGKRSLKVQLQDFLNKNADDLQSGFHRFSARGSGGHHSHWTRKRARDMVERLKNQEEGIVA